MRAGPTPIDELIAIILPKAPLPAHLRPSDLLDDAVTPPARVAAKVHALRALVKSGGRCDDMLEKVATSKDIIDWFRAYIGGDTLESLWVVGMDNRMRVVLRHQVCRGGSTMVAVLPRDVLRPLILAARCASGIVIHSHPSGDPAPSADDIAFTERIVKAGDALGLRVLDHVIVASEGAFSFLDAGILPRR